PLIHLHEGDPRLGLSSRDGPCDWRRAAIFGEQRSMHVDASETRSREHVLREDASVRNDERDVGILLAKPGREIPGLELRRLNHRQTERQRALLHGGHSELETTALWFVGLADDTDDVGNLDQSLETRHCELRRAEKDGPEGSSAHLLGSRRGGLCHPPT